MNAQSSWSELSLEQLLDPTYLEAQLRALQAWLVGELLVASMVFQAIVIALAFLVARFLAPRVRAWVERETRQRGLEGRLERGAAALAPLTLPVCWLIIQWLSVLVAANAGWPHHLIKTVVSLLTAWVIIRLTSSLVRDPVWSQAVAMTAWTIAALNILELLHPTIALLDQLAISLGGVRISALTVIKGMLAMAVLLGLATFASRLFERRIKGAPSLTPSVQVLFVKLLKIVLVTIAIVVALSSVGIDLTAFALFSGAVGVGIGFGLQKVVANLISGVILLLDRSVKPGDVIGVGNSYGWIDSLGARYVSVVTGDGIEHLIPNEELIANRVENWSYSNDLVRLKIPVGIAYDSDLRQAMRVCLDAARATPRVLDQPPPACLVTGFGDSSVDMEVGIWIRDPTNGTGNVKSGVLLNIWDRFREHGIEIPFPQRDLHIKTPGEFGGSPRRRSGCLNHSGSRSLPAASAWPPNPEPCASPAATPARQLLILPTVPMVEAIAGGIGGPLIATQAMRLQRLNGPPAGPEPASPTSGATRADVPRPTTCSRRSTGWFTESFDTADLKDAKALLDELG